MKVTIAFSCKDSSMLVSSIIEVEINSNSPLNVIMSIGTIPCFHFDTRMLYNWKVIIKKLQCPTVVGQEMVAINDLQLPKYMHFLVEP